MALRPAPALAFTWLLVVAACGPHAEPATPSAPEPARAAVDPAASSPVPVASADPDGDDKRARPRKPLSIHNLCARVVTLAFGDDPKAATASKRILAPDATFEGPRDADGKQTVWLLDDKGEPLPVKVHVTRGMKQLEIGRSCTTLDAH